MPSNPSENEEPLDLGPVFLRQLVWDALPCHSAEEACAAVGLTPTSPDVTQQEHAASHRRFEQVLPVLPFAAAASSHMADVHARLALHGQEGDPDLPAGALKTLQDHYGAVIGSSVLAVLSQMLDNGVLSYGSGRRR